MPAPSVHHVTHPLPGVDLYLFRLKGEEELGRPFHYEVEVMAEKADIKADQLLGKPMTVTVIRPDESERHFHGLVTRFSYEDKRGEFYMYKATLRPWFWFLAYTRDCRIFQKLSVTEIFSKVCKDKNGFSDFDDKGLSALPKREYCCQYRESDFDFISRLLEEEGIYFYFKHDKTKHTLVLADAPGQHTPIDGEAEIPFMVGGEARVEMENINDWYRARQVQTGNYVLRDFDFEKPSDTLETRMQKPKAHSQSGFEQYDYPGDYTVIADGNKIVAKRLEEIQWQYAPIHGQGNATGLSVGRRFTLKQHPDKAENAEYLVVKTEIDIQSGEVDILAVDSENRFNVKFVAIEAKEQFRPPRSTPRPIIAGPQTAIVVGPQGEEIWTDKYGRVKVQFHWDREGKKDENSSCFVRVAQLWAGKNWGGIHIPRIGQEVIVEFLEGDPDRPLITGRVYNAEQMPPYALPTNATQSGVKSRSSKQGTTQNFNELRFEDKKDAEEVYFHAEKDFNRVVENNDTLKVGFEKKDQGDQSIEIFNNQTLKIGNAQAADGSQTIEVWKDRTESVKTGNEKVTIEKGNRDVAVSMGNDTLTVGMGNLTIKVNMGIVSVTAGQKIELKVGASSMVMDMMSITLKSPMITVDGQITTDVKGLLTTVDGTAINTIKGGIVLIN